MSDETGVVSIPGDFVIEAPGEVIESHTVTLTDDDWASIGRVIRGQWQDAMFSGDIDSEEHLRSLFFNLQTQLNSGE